MEQAGLIYHILPQYIANPNTTEGLRIYRSTVDNLYYVKKPDGTSELFSAGISGTNPQFRGGYNASTNLFPATGGSGPAGAILAGNSWVITVGGTVGGEVVIPGDLIIALVDAPAQVAGNWTAIENNIGYTPENSANKATDFTVINDILYPSVKAVNDELTANYEPTLGFTPEDAANKVTNFTTVNNTLYPSAQATEGRYNASLFQQLVDSGNVGVGLQTLYTNTIAANKLSINGDAIEANYSIKLAANANNKVISFSFAGQQIFLSVDTFSIGTPFDVDMEVLIIRTGVATARAMVSLALSGLNEVVQTDLAGLDFTIPNNLILQGEGVANDDVLAKFAKASFEPAS